jgi:hypothetical protein
MRGRFGKLGGKLGRGRGASSPTSIAIALRLSSNAISIGTGQQKRRTKSETKVNAWKYEQQFEGSVLFPRNNGPVFFLLWRLL